MERGRGIALGFLGTLGETEGDILLTCSNGMRVEDEQLLP